MNKLTKYNNRTPSLFGDFFTDSWFDKLWTSERFDLTSVLPDSLKEDEKSYVAEIALPGFKKEQIRVSTRNNLVSITAKNDNSSFVRSFYLDDADVEKAEVKLEDGILKLNIPKLLVTEPKVLEIK